MQDIFFYKNSLTLIQVSVGLKFTLFNKWSEETTEQGIFTIVTYFIALLNTDTTYLLS